MSFKSLLAANPKIAAQWHPIKNGTLTAKDVSFGSSKMIWWKCSKGADHEWQTTPNTRSFYNSGCPFCVGQRVSVTNSLSTVKPKISKEWHPTKNGNFTPKDIVAKSSKIVWWKCPKGPDHEWRASPNDRVGQQKQGCPFCAGQRVSVTNSLKTKYPNIAKELHPTKNGKISPENIYSNSRMNVWWKCPKGPDHEWRAAVRDRTGKNKNGCPCCAGRKLSKTNSLISKFPKIAAQWHPTKNGSIKPNVVLAGSKIKFWWKCPKGPDHEWQALLSNRVNNNAGCPCCSGYKVSITNSLSSVHPEIAVEWHPTKNGSRTPDEVVIGSNKKVWWKCPKGPDHEWQTTVVARTFSKTDCPCCSGRKVSTTNSLKNLFPKIAKEWHLTKNGSLTPDKVVSGSNKKRWWKCSKGADHEWQAAIQARTGSRESGCPLCTIVPRSKQEIYLAFEILKLIKFDINEHKIKIGKKIYDVDIIIKKISLIVEFDGSYWHKDKTDIDIAKSKALTKAGWTVIRVRERPLKKLSNNNILFKTNDTKDASDKLLAKVRERYNLELPNFEKYLKRKTLINKKAADAYINKLLSGKC